ncbi:uncharacterized protein LOC135950589 [Calliphora vicina]|uniref:uncharacterized protein LOC135950589 n=1 Tax=Calliphora vicina TaxID=7373 RepID=UPI00325BB7B0
MSLLDSFIKSSDKVVEFEAYLADLPIGSHSICSLDIHKDEILIRWSDFRKSYDKILLDYGSLEEEVTMESIKDRFYKTYGSHVRALSKVKEILDSFPAKDSPISQTEAPTTSYIPNISLPPCDTEVFYGDYVSWPSFRDMFSALYGNNPRLTNIEKLCHLLKKTQGEAHDILKTCPLNNHGFEMAWQNLVDRYENKRVLINAQLKILFNLSPVTKESGPNIKRIQRTINDCVTNLTLLDIRTDNWDVIFVFVCSISLPDLTLNLWEQSLRDSSDLPTWKQMDAFLTARYQTLESVTDIRSSMSNNHSTTTRKNNPNKKSHSFESRKLHNYQTNVTSNPPRKCTLCELSHPLRLCPTFLKMTVEERSDVVKREKRCFNCLATSHSIKQCQSQYVCTLCKKKHNSLLHRSDTPNTPAQKQPSHLTATTTPNSNNQDNSRVSNTYHTPKPLLETPTSSHQIASKPRQVFATKLQSTLTHSIVLGTALVDICIQNTRCTVRALIDTASEATFISKRLQTKLSLPTKSSQTQITGLSGSLTATATRICSLTISSPIEKQFVTQADAYVINKLTGDLPYHDISSLLTSKFPDIQLADTFSNISSHIDLLLGGDVYPKIIRDGVRYDPNQSIVAQCTIFGWILTGKLESESTQPLRSISSFMNTLELNKQLTRFWELEDLPNKVTLSEEDNLCENLYKTTTFRDPNARFVVSLPFKSSFPDSVSLGLSRGIAFSQFTRNETRLLKNPNLKDEYDRVIEEYATLGHMQLVHPTPSVNPNTSYYLPHHSVIKPESTTTKLRVVFNASSPSSNGTSLNDVLYPGPTLQQDLTILISRWRLFRFVFNADIEKMYRQIRVHPSHTLYQRIIFRKTPNVEPQDFELKTVTFGVNCAPYLAIRTLLELAKICESQYPEVSNILRNYMYVDDVLAGSHELSHAISARDNLNRVLNSAGFSLRKWISNDKTLLEGLNPEHLLNADFLKLSDNATTKTLGLRWNAGQDFFYFNPSRHPNRETTTKREVLSEIARLFDPAGWLAPKIVTAKMIMQKIWLDKTEWDENIKEDTLKQWHLFLKDYPNIEKINIPRFVDYNPTFFSELHGFCDASEKAYCATLYLRTTAPSGNIFTHLLLAKTKVAPVKFVTLPRIELCGAELLGKMIHTFRAQINIDKCDLYLWTDSMIVLAWLGKHPSHWTTFVANRIASIVEKVGNDKWRHVCSKDNPADLGSRGLSAQDLISNSLWWHGPHWLSRPRFDWPSRPIISETHEEVRPVKTHLSQLPDEDILSRFSDLARAIRVISYIFRFYNATHPLLKQNFNCPTVDLQHSEMKFVKNRLIVICQNLHFSEYNLLSRGIVLPRKSHLLPLNPFIDPTEFLRVNGRLSQCPTLSYEERFPKILPYAGRFTRLYLELLHKYSVHGENSLLLRLMRLEFWVPKLKNLIKTTISNCKLCVLYKHKRSQQIMAALPPERTTLLRPFTNTGLDFAGPFHIKTFAGRGCKITKGYVLVLVCFSTKAIHLEATSEISTQAFLAAFARFFSRRGTPRAIFSDNGTAFVGASNILNRDQSTFLNTVRRNLMSQQVFQTLEWHFIPAGAPHMGGLWEAGVKSLKAHLKKITHAQNFTFEEFTTMLARIEACLNSRPLSPMSDNPEDLCALTPGHFLIGAPLLSPPEPDFSSQSLSYINRWQKLKLLHHHFACRWKNEYLQEMHKRIKWKYPQRNFAVNDLVVVKQDNLPPYEWRVGRIEKLIPGDDNNVRVVSIRTSTGLILRPIVKLVLLPFSHTN